MESPEGENSSTEYRESPENNKPPVNNNAGLRFNIELIYRSFFITQGFLLYQLNIIQGRLKTVKDNLAHITVRWGETMYNV